MNTRLAVDPYAKVVGQPTVVEHLRACANAPVHAYLLVGPPGRGAAAVAVAFAADLLCRVGADEAAERTCTLALEGKHPDVVVVGAEGTAVRRVEAERLRDAAVRSPMEGDRKVLVGLGFDVIGPEAAALLLKTVEEPVPSTVLVLVAEDLPPELVTLASRCVRIDVGPRDAQAVRAALEAEAAAEGWDVAKVAEVVSLTEGDLQRARVLLGDERFALRRDAWLAVPDQLDGTGATAYRLVEELLAMVDDVVAPLGEQQAKERAALEEDIEAYGLRRSVVKDLEAHHKRQTRRVHRDELVGGLRLLARRYRDEAVAAAAHGDGDRLDVLLEAQEALGRTAASFVRNPNERLQLQALLLRLPGSVVSSST
ncbi:MAG: hypothetical protein JJU45_03010 [Acidimicrobiia bacterium]|nr:hypothetical protein [Acidimicrobiia bacterium]